MHISRITIVGTGTPATTASGMRLAPAGTSTITHGGTVHVLDGSSSTPNLPGEVRRQRQVHLGDGTRAFKGISCSGSAPISEIAIDRPGVCRASGWMPARSPSQISY